MTDQTKIKTKGRAQIFALLRESATEPTEPTRPNYLDDATADLLIMRAMSSFKAPACAADTNAPAQAKAIPKRATGRVKPRILTTSSGLHQGTVS